MICESLRLKKTNSDWLNSGITVIIGVQYLSAKMGILAFLLPGSAESLVRCGRKIKHILIAYFLM